MLSVHVTEVLTGDRGGWDIAYRKPHLSAMRLIQIVCSAGTTHLGRRPTRFPSTLQVLSDQNHRKAVIISSKTNYIGLEVLTTINAQNPTPVSEHLRTDSQLIKLKIHKPIQAWLDFKDSRYSRFPLNFTKSALPSRIPSPFIFNHFKTAFCVHSY
jgi:hypothetical protein